MNATPPTVTTGLVGDLALAGVFFETQNALRAHRDANTATDAKFFVDEDDFVHGCLASKTGSD